MEIRKRIAGSTVFNEIVASLFASYLRFCFATTRWEREGFEEMNAILQADQPLIMVLWHERLWMSPYMFDTTLGKICAITSESRIAYLGKFLLRRFDFETIMIDPGKNPVALNRQLFKRIRDGYSVAISPDGTRGPSRVAKPFPIIWARKTQMPIVCVTFAVRHRLRMPTWDRSHVPLPFTRGVLAARRWDEPVPDKTTPDEMDALALRLQDALNALTDEADRKVGRKPTRG